MKKKLVLASLPLIDRLLLPFVDLAGRLLRAVRRLGVRRLPRCRDHLIDIGLFPLQDHYYEPRFDFRAPRRPFAAARVLPGIDWNLAGQCAWLARMGYADELAGLPTSRPEPFDFHFDNDAFEAGDAEYFYQLLRVLKPRRLYEIGSGYSTLLAQRALARNRTEDLAYTCDHVCIEPYEMAWLEGRGVRVVREPVEHLGSDFFAALSAGDLLFIDSSHVIRPQGDVLFEYLELLPTLAPGVVVHVHDIFSPHDYLERWLREDVRFWNEQYLLEAFLCHNAEWEIIGALNYLHHHHPQTLAAVAPYLTPAHEPGSIYLRRRD